jgi:hypothetical protein
MIYYQISDSVDSRVKIQHPVAQVRCVMILTFCCHGWLDCRSPSQQQGYAHSLANGRH